MSNYKLGRLKVKNFKSYTEEFIWDFSNQDLVVLDGPNGFGKTSLYDAIEVSLTGSVSRFRNIKETKIKNRNMLVSSNGEEGQPALLLLELLDNENTCIIATKIESKKGVTKDWMNDIQRVILDYWPEDLTEIQFSYSNNVTDQLIDKLNFPELIKMFSVLNYIQQEDTLHFIKQNEQDRFTAISHLFGTVEEKNTLLKELVVIQSNEEPSELTGKTVKQVKQGDSKNLLNKYIDGLNALKEIITNDGVNKWDKKNKRHQINTWLEPHNKKTIFNLLYHYETNNFNKVEKLKAHINWVSNTIKKCKDYSSIKATDLTAENFLTDKLLGFLETRFVTLYNKSVLEIERYKNLLVTQGSSETLLNEVLTARKSLIDKFKIYNTKDAEDKINCPLCGIEHKDLMELIKGYEKHAEIFEKSITTTNLQVQNSLLIISNDLLNPAITLSKKRYEKYKKYNENFKVSLQNRQISKDSFDKISQDKKWFEDNIKEFSNYVSLGLFYETYDVKANFYEVKEILENIDIDLSKQVDNDVVEIMEKLIDIGIDKNSEVTDWNIVEEDVNKDIKYIQRQINLLNNTEYNNLHIEINEKTIEKNNFEKIKIALEDGIQIYKKNITKYEKDIAKKVQIPFYNISRKILQTRVEANTLASGIVLETPDKEKAIGYYRFCSSVAAEHDAWSTMSSGQLAGVVISFMLAMNKVYPTGLKTLLIDDPIQTMDDINMASFIQLLREEFSDYQIIMSTHESRVANYSIYKYRLSGLNSKAINLKNRQSIPTSAII